MSVSYCGSLYNTIKMWTKFFASACINVSKHEINKRNHIKKFIEEEEEEDEEEEEEEQQQQQQQQREMGLEVNFFCLKQFLYS